MTYRLLMCLLLAAGPVSAQEIYRVVDEDGNVTYTDQKPSDDAEPMELPELNVLDQSDDPVAVLDRAGEEAQESDSLGFRIEQPAENSRLPASRPVHVNMAINIDVPATAQIVVHVDGRPREPVRSLETTLEPLPAGPHSLHAELQTPGGRVLARTDSVRFQVNDEAGTP